MFVLYSRMAIAAARRRESGPATGRPAVLFVLPWRLDAAGDVNRVVQRLVEGFCEIATYPQRTVARVTHGDIAAFYEYYLPAPCDERRMNAAIARRHASRHGVRLHLQCRQALTPSTSRSISSGTV